MPIVWADGWNPTRTVRRRRYIAGELRWELGHFPDHPLTNTIFTIVGGLDKYDNFIVALDDLRTYAHVRLTWKMESPRYELIGDESALNDFLATSAMTPGTRN